MSTSFITLLKKYDYVLPRALIAQSPAVPRDSARLLIYTRKNKKIALDTFRNIGQYLPPRAVLVFNETRVVPARLPARKESGGAVKLLCLGVENGLLRALSPKNLPLRSTLILTSKIFFIVEKKVGETYFIRPSVSLKKLPEILKTYGKTPIPPYIKHTPLTERALRKQYQTVFAKYDGSVAAPTAALHFTRPLLAQLKRQRFGVEFVNLEVGLGTFAPLTLKNIQSRELHAERYHIDARVARRLMRAKKEGRPVIAVGTTVVRTLESAATSSGILDQLSGATTLFISEGYQPRFVDGLITNFHVPRSSLLMLVSAFVPRRKLFDLYRYAIRRRFRFFSFGDGMFVY